MVSRPVGGGGGGGVEGFERTPQTQNTDKMKKSVNKPERL